MKTIRLVLLLAVFVSSSAVMANFNVAFVLGGGGARGLAHVGVMEELIAAGIKPDLIVGCSAGAIVGALYAQDQNLQQVKTILINKKRENLVNISLQSFPLAVSNGDEMVKFLAQNLKAQNFSQLKIPVICAATDFESGKLVELDTGDLKSAVHASAACPGLFLPVIINNKSLVDGGIANPIPVKVAKERGSKFIIAIDLSGSPMGPLPTNIFGVIKRSAEISFINQCVEFSQHADHVIKIPFEDIGIFEDGNNVKSYELGRQAGRAAVKIIKQKMQLKNL